LIRYLTEQMRVRATLMSHSLPCFIRQFISIIQPLKMNAIQFRGVCGGGFVSWCRLMDYPLNRTQYITPSRRQPTLHPDRYGCQSYRSLCLSHRQDTHLPHLGTWAEWTERGADNCPQPSLELPQRSHTP